MWYGSCNSLACPNMTPSIESRSKKFNMALLRKTIFDKEESWWQTEWLATAGRQVGHWFLVSEWKIMCSSISIQGRAIYELAPCCTVCSLKSACWVFAASTEERRQRKDRLMCHMNHRHGSNAVLPWVISTWSWLLYLLIWALQQQIWKCPCRSLAIRCYQRLSFLDICLKNIFLKGIPSPCF